MKLKEKLKLDFIEESWDFGQKNGICLCVTWKNFPIIRHAVTSETAIYEGTEIVEYESEDEVTGEITKTMIEVPKFIRQKTLLELTKEKEMLKSDLLEWYSEYFWDYDDATALQKKKMKNIQPVKGYKIENYAVLKRLKVRNSGYSSVSYYITRTFLIDLL
jgi:hypothetical protein